MRHTAEHHRRDSSHGLREPIVRRMRWPFPIIWIVPIIAAICAGIYFYQLHQERSERIAIQFSDVNGLQPGETVVRYRGVQIGKIDSVELASGNQPVANVALNSSARDFAKAGARFWIVKPDVSEGNISGLSTIVSGAYVDSTPGNGAPTHEFAGLDRPPATLQDGLKIILHAPRLEKLQSGSAVFFRGIQVGTVLDTQLSADATGVDAHLIIWRRFEPLVRTNSQFWIVKGVDIQGSLLGGAKVKFDSLRALLSGGVTFATPDEKTGPEKTGPVAPDGANFPLYDEPRKEWLDWSPKIDLPAPTKQDQASSDRDSTQESQRDAKARQATSAIKSK